MCRYIVCFLCVFVQSVRGMLENPTEGINELSYFDCIDSVMENSKVRTSSLSTHHVFLISASSHFFAFLCIHFTFSHNRCFSAALKCIH